MTTQSSKSRTLLVAGSILALSLAAVAFVPTASAHSCSAENPSVSCGECTTGYHRHDYTGGGAYCHSDGEDGGGGGGGCPLIPILGVAATVCPRGLPDLLSLTLQ